MKTIVKKSLIPVLVSIMILLSACQGAAAETQVVEAAQPAVQETEVAAPAEPVAQTVDASNLDAQQLLIGTIKLQGTDQEITVEQASALLPLWTNYQTLTANMSPAPNPGGNDDAAQETPVAAEENVDDSQNQVNELLDEIRSAMTAEQISAIEAMQIDQDSLQTLMEELGITVDVQSQTGDGSQPQGGGPGGGGGGPADGSTPPDGGGNPPSDGGTPPDGGGNAPSGDGQTMDQGDNAGRGGRGSMLNPELLTAMIEYLTQRSTQ